MFAAQAKAVEAVRGKHATKGNPNQPRVPAGSPDGGEFGSGGGRAGGAAGRDNKKPIAGRDAATSAEYRAARKQAQTKIDAAPVPPPEKVEKMRAALERAKTDPKARAGGDARGSSADRKARSQRLFAEFGGNEKGYVVCHGTGQRLHWTSDPKLNPHGYDKFEQGKIFTAHQGGSYRFENLLPESFAYNRGRNDAILRPENTK